MASAVGITGLTLMASCSVERDYRTLSFFFDGVPDPNAPPPPTQDPVQHRPGSASWATSEDQPERPQSSTHKPFLNRQCKDCHVIPEGSEARPAWMIGKPKLLIPVEELCAKCHEPPEAAFVHGPVAMQRCDLCHLPHESRFPHLLKLESTNQICLSCHAGETFVTEQSHADLGPMDCTTCHDPHASSYPFFLKVDEPQEDQGAESGGASSAPVEPEPGS